MLSTGIFGDSVSPIIDNSKTVLFARPVECLLQPSPTEGGTDVSLPFVTEDDVGFKFHVMDDFEKLKAMTYEIPLSKDENQSHGTILSDSDCVESLRNGFIVNSSQNVLDVEVHTEGSDAVLLQDRNFLNVSAASWQLDNSPAREQDVSLENVEELIDLFVKESESEVDVEREDPLFSLLDVYCPIENQETSLFPLPMSFPSSTITDCSDNICSSFMDYNEKSLTSSHAVCCGNNLPGHFSNETTTLDYNFGNLLTTDTPSDVSPYTTEPALQQSEYNLGIDDDFGSMPELRCRERGRVASKRRSSRKRGKSHIKRKRVSSKSKVLSVSEVQNNSSCFEKLSEIEPEGLSFCSLSQKASEQVQLAASGNGYVSEFAKFVNSIINNHNSAVQASECPPGITSQLVTQTTEFQNHEIHVLEKQSKRNNVKSKIKEDSKDCLVDLSFTMKQTSSKRFIQKPACACCMKMGKDSSLIKVNKSRKRRSCPAKHQGSVKNTEKCRQLLEYRIAIDTYMTCQEQLRGLQRKLFRLLHVLFPFLAGWKYIRPHSHSLEHLIDEVTDSLKNSTRKRKAEVWQPCCPTVTLCRFPALCLRKLQQKAVVLINLLIPSLHVGEKACGQLETIIDQLISSNANAGCSNHL